MNCLEFLIFTKSVREVSSEGMYTGDWKLCWGRSRVPTSVPHAPMNGNWCPCFRNESRLHRPDGAIPTPDLVKSDPIRCIFDRQHERPDIVRPNAGEDGGGHGGGCHGEAWWRPLPQPGDQTGHGNRPRAGGHVHVLGLDGHQGALERACGHEPEGPYVVIHGHRRSVEVQPGRPEVQPGRPGKSVDGRRRREAEDVEYDGRGQETDDERLQDLPLGPYFFSLLFFFCCCFFF